MYFLFDYDYHLVTSGAYRYIRFRKMQNSGFRTFSQWRIGQVHLVWYDVYPCPLAEEQV